MTKKNRKEKGRRRAELGSNPHSKGEDFSRLNLIFLPNKIDRKKTKEQMSLKITTKAIK